VVNGDIAASGATCTGTSIVVAGDGTARFDVGPLQALAIHRGAEVGGN
jgi:hypothetical protein